VSHGRQELNTTVGYAPLSYLVMYALMRLSFSMFHFFFRSRISPRFPLPRFQRPQTTWSTVTRSDLETFFQLLQISRWPVILNERSFCGSWRSCIIVCPQKELLVLKLLSSILLSSTVQYFVETVKHIVKISFDTWYRPIILV